METKEELQKLENDLDSYLNSLGLKNLMYNPEIDECFGMSQDQLSHLTDCQCAEKAILLAEYSFFLQKEYNRQNGIKSWADKKLIELTAKEGSNYDKYTKWEAKRALIVNDNEYAKKLDEVYSSANQRCDEINHLAHSISILADKLSELNKTKRYKK